jgi:hypothetical protein
VDKPWKVVLAFVAVFMAGAVFGGLFTLRASGRRFADWQAQTHPPAAQPQPPLQVPPPGPASAHPAAAAQPKPAAPPAQPAQNSPSRAPLLPAIMRQFNQRLNLRPAQRERIRPIVDRAAEDLQRLREDIERERQRNLADTVRVTERMYADVAALLSPDQREELEKMRAQMQERVEKERKHRAELMAETEARLKAERAGAAPPSAGEAKPPATPPPPAAVPPAAKPPGGN